MWPALLCFSFPFLLSLQAGKLPCRTFDNSSAPSPFWSPPFFPPRTKKGTVWAGAAQAQLKQYCREECNAWDRPNAIVGDGYLGTYSCQRTLYDRPLRNCQRPFNRHNKEQAIKHCSYSETSRSWGFRVGGWGRFQLNFLRHSHLLSVGLSEWRQTPICIWYGMYQILNVPPRECCYHDLGGVVYIVSLWHLDKLHGLFTDINWTLTQASLLTYTTTVPVLKSSLIEGIQRWETW